MIALASGVQVYLACGTTDMRNYAESPVMRSPRQSWAGLPRLIRSWHCA